MKEHTAWTNSTSMVWNISIWYVSSKKVGMRTDTILLCELKICVKYWYEYARLYDEMIEPDLF
jgi:hypothetical protein